MRRWLVCFLAASLSVMALAEDNASDAAWARVLEEHVDERGRVDFASLAADPGDLESYIAFIAAANPHSTPKRFAAPDTQLAHYLNSYNALAMYNVIDSGIPRSLSSFVRKFWFFYWKKFPVGGRKISLYAYENDVIRKFGDPRVHFALNCMAVSCPRLPRVPFDAESLQSQLDAATREFFTEARNLRVDHETATVAVSAILEFYPEDFLQVAPSIIAYINRYRDDAIPENYTVRYLDYDWTVNRQ